MNNHSSDIQIEIDCDADGALLRENSGFVSPSSTYGELCPSIQGSLEILVMVFYRLFFGNDINSDNFLYVRATPLSSIFILFLF